MFCRAIISSLCFFLLLTNTTTQHNYKVFSTFHVRPSIATDYGWETRMHEGPATSRLPFTTKIVSCDANLPSASCCWGPTEDRQPDVLQGLSGGSWSTVNEFRCDAGRRLWNPTGSLQDHDCHKVRFITLCKRKRRSNGARDGWKKVGRLCSKGLFPQKEIACKQTDKQTGRHVWESRESGIE